MSSASECFPETVSLLGSGLRANVTVKVDPTMILLALSDFTVMIYAHCVCMFAAVDGPASVLVQWSRASSLQITSGVL